MNLEGVYIQLATLFTLMFFGYILGKIKIITTVGTEVFSKFVIKVSMPALIISGMMIPLTDEKLYKAGVILILSIAAYGLAFIVGIITAKILTKDKGIQGIYSFAIVFSNAGFMGIPVLQAIYGKEAVFYVVINNIVFNVLLFTLGIKLMSAHQDEKQKFKLKALINPGILASILGMVLFITNLSIPEFLVGTVNSVGSLCTPLSMITIGAMLSDLPIKKMFNSLEIYLLTIVRLIILPLLTLVLLKYVMRIEDVLLLGVPIIVAGMPVGTNTGMMAKEYGNSSEISSQTILISTLFSCITIPLLAYIL